jgi:hypothetical protein
MTVGKGPRFKLCEKAVEAGLQFSVMQTWWPELAPLNRQERRYVKLTVQEIMDASKIEARRG